MVGRVFLLFSLMAASSSQSLGPCHIQSNGLACTRNGYYEMTQCTSRDCFCVAAHTGVPAEGTRTGNSRQLPACSKCHFTLREIYSSSLSLSPTAYVPTCDTKNGDFTEIQCHPSSRECWCVDVRTGEERRGTRKVHSNSELMQCGPQTGGKGGRTPMALNGKKIQYPVARETCKLRPDRGHSCSGKTPSLMYYFDSNHADCFAFEYLGCGGNENKHESKSACHSSCNLADMFSCSGLLESNGTCNVDPMPPPAPGAAAVQPECPKGYRCMMGAFFGFCCNEEVEDFYHKEYSPSCPNGAQPHKDNNGDWEETRLGTSCSHNFCPSNRKCQQGALFTYCC